jgi:23S rRNA-/tRNA-specific pseudouridylate synthase
LNTLFEHRRVSKTYIALVHGAIEEPMGAINRPLRRFGSGRMGADAERGKPCRTEFTVAERLPGCTLVRINSLTGRKHQIRAHFFSIGHPIVGDTLYGDKALQKTFPRLMLHALSLCLTLPTGEYACLESEIPSDFKKYFTGRT